MAWFIRYASSLSLLSSLASALQPHGLQFETPVAFSPSAFDFFHPGAARAPSVAPHSSFSSAKVRADRAQESVWSSSAAPRKTGGFGAGLVATLLLGLVCVVVVTAFVAVRVRAGKKRTATIIQPDA